jgi:uncharacterized protein (DUF433 family)
MSSPEIVITDQSIPLSLDERGLYRIAGTRVTLDCVVEMWLEGATPEEIVEHYDALQLDDIYAVITYYLRHQQEVDQYLAQQHAESDAAQRDLNSIFPSELLNKIVKAKRMRMTGDR